MGNIVDLRPVGETLEFGGEAAEKRDWLIGRFAKLAKKLNSLIQDTGGHERLEELNTEVVALQTEYAEALVRVTSMAEICEAVHHLRDTLGKELPDQKTVLLIAAHSSHRRAVGLSIERRGVRFLCKNFEIFEHSACGGVAAVFDRYAAA